MGLRVKSWIKKVNINLFFLRGGEERREGKEVISSDISQLVLIR